ncbi:MAG: dTMP kinase [Nitrospira sp.]|nr:dTMP kinase [Nitrospira sp.]
MPSPSRQRRGLFISLEGGEGSGKTTQALRLFHLLTAKGYDVVQTREPGGTAVAERLRGILLDRSDETVTPETEALLMLAARRQHVEHVIRPALASGKVVICDRFSDSTLAYQGYGRGLDLKLLRMINRWVTDTVTPHLTLFFDIPIAAGLKRRRGHSAEQNRLDHETHRFHAKVRSGFQALATREPRRIKILDARRSPDSVAVEVERLVLDKLQRSTVPTRKTR